MVWSIRLIKKFVRMARALRTAGWKFAATDLCVPIACLSYMNDAMGENELLFLTALSLKLFFSHASRHSDRM